MIIFILCIFYILYIAQVYLVGMGLVMHRQQTGRHHMYSNVYLLLWAPVRCTTAQCIATILYHSSATISQPPKRPPPEPPRRSSDAGHQGAATLMNVMIKVMTNFMMNVVVNLSYDERHHGLAPKPDLQDVVFRRGC